MRFPNRPSVAVALRLVLLVSVALFGLTPFVARAGAPGAPPPAVQVVFDARIGADNQAVAFNGEATVNRTGDMYLAATLTSPERHTLDAIVVNDVVYLSADGGTYESGTIEDFVGDLGGGLGAGIAGGAPGAMSAAGLVPASCLAPIIPGGAAGLRTLAGAGVTVTQADGGTIAGVAISLLSVHANISTALASLSALVRSVGATCGLSQADVDALGQLSSAQVRQLLAGSALDVAVYSEQANDFPRRIDVKLDVPSLPLNLQFRADLTPLATPAPIAPPARSVPVASGG
jgi:hypothetical protein